MGNALGIKLSKGIKEETKKHLQGWSDYSYPTVHVQFPLGYIKLSKGIKEETKKTSSGLV